MIRHFKYFSLIIFALLNGRTSSQNEAKKWYFGNNCALDFSTSPPTILAGSAISTWEGCSSIADGSGNLLFYTNGIDVWNKSHVLMANGTGLAGDNSSSQSALIVKQPGSATNYFIFTTDGRSNGLRYSMVDMNLAAGMGSVTVKNVLISPSSTERLCGTKHCNGTDVWVISHDIGNVFRANLVTAAGVNTTGVLSSIGTHMTGMGCMKVSPNGKKLGAANYFPYAFELFDFNTVTGVVSNSLSLPVSLPPYGCEFSPDGTKFYGSLWDAFKGNKLRQWDLCAGTNQAIIASGTSFDANRMGQLQLAPDGKIYQARATFRRMKLGPETSVDVVTGESMLGVIHNPNASAASVNFNNTAQSVSPGLSLLGLPNFVSGFYKTPVAQFTYSDNPATSCLRIYFTSPPLINATCSATSYTINTVKWIFDDPASGAANTSSVLNPDHTYPGTGTYIVRLVLYNSCGGVIDTLKQQVVVGGALVNHPSTFSICSGQSLTLAAAGTSATYSWNTGATSGTIVVTPNVNTTYSLSYTDSFGCLRRSVMTVTVNPLPVISVWKQDTICESHVAFLKVSGGVTYSWSTGATNSTINVTPTVTTVYTVTGTSNNGCSVQKLAKVVVNSSPLPVIMGNTLVCAGSIATASVVEYGNAKYSWNTGMTGPTFTVIPNQERYIFSVTAKYANGCSRFQRIRYNIKQLPVITIAGDPTVCAGSVVTRTATGARTYTWSNGVTTNPAKFTLDENTTFTVTGADSNNCVSTGTVSIDVLPSPQITVSPNTSICEGEKISLSARGGHEYTWTPFQSIKEITNNTIVVSPTISTIYTVAVSNYSINNCVSTRTVEVLLKPLPTVWAGPDTIFNQYNPMYLTAKGSGIITWISGENIACPDCRRTQIFPVKKACYVAQALNEYGCSATDEVCIDLEAEFAVYIPNSFTPDGDGLNDEFFIKGFGISKVTLKIYDRWGEKIYSSGEQDQAWDGSFRGVPCRAGIYNWVVEYSLPNGRRVQKAGHVNLLTR
jgi:gliding motility-associated-like protein